MFIYLPDKATLGENQPWAYLAQRGLTTIIVRAMVGLLVFLSNKIQAQPTPMAVKASHRRSAVISSLRERGLQSFGSAIGFQHPAAVTSSI